MKSCLAFLFFCVCSVLGVENQRDTADEVFELVRKSTINIVNLTRPILANEIVKEYKKNFNRTILLPIETTLQEHSKELKYDKSSIMYLNTDVSLIKDDVRDIRNTSRRTESKLHQLQNYVQIMDIRLETIQNSTTSMKKKLNDMQVSVEDNTTHLVKLEKMMMENNKEMKDAAAENNEELRYLNSQMQNLTAIFYDWIAAHNKTLNRS